MLMSFSKYEGTGNDFILIDDRNLLFPSDENLIRLLCDRHFGIGADGLLLIQEQKGYDFSMKYFNSDGSQATFCGNGGRCITAFAYHLGIITGNCKFIASDGIHHSRIFEKDRNPLIIELSMQDPVVYSNNHDLFYLNTGTYHVVKFVDNPETVDIIEKGRAIRYNELYSPHGTNVNFAHLFENELYVRTYEKGVENETLSCGTGVTASAIAASLKYGGNNFIVNTAGGKLSVNFVRTENSFKKVKLTGPARLIFQGEIEI